MAGEAGRFASQAAALRAAMDDLAATYPDRYPVDARFLRQLSSVGKDGFVPYGQDAARLAHRKKYAEYERLVREAIREGRELYDSGFTGDK